MSQTIRDTDIIDQIWARLPGDGTPNTVRLAMHQHPFVSALLLLLGGDAPREMASLVAKQNEQVRVIAASLHELPALGWAISSQIPVDAYRDALKSRAAGGTTVELEEALVAAWNDSPILGHLPARVRLLGAGDDELGAIAAERARLVELAWQHHINGAYEASVPIVLAQIDGITHDATSSPTEPGGRSFFSMRSSRQADVADDETLAGIDQGLPAVRAWYSGNCVPTTARGTANRHGVLHGRELRYDTQLNSTKSFVLLLAIWEWANRRLAAEAERKRAARYDEHAGSDESDQNGWRLDRRGFTQTRLQLRTLADAQWSFVAMNRRFGSFTELLVESSARSLLAVGAPTPMIVSADSWWAHQQSEFGWTFAIGGDRTGTTYYFDAADAPPTGPPGPGWRTTDDGNWSGDCHW